MGGSGVLSMPQNLNKFTNISRKPVCLLNRDIMAVSEEYNMRRHYETKHKDKLKCLNAEQTKKESGRTEEE